MPLPLTIPIFAAIAAAAGGGGGGGGEDADWSATISEQYLQADVPTAGDKFGHSMSISDDNLIMVIGAINDDGKGAAHVFEKQTGTWTHIQKLVASDAASGDEFGFAVKISGDGKYIFVGAPSESTNLGKVYCFLRSGSTWTEKDTLATGIPSFFGNAIDCSTDGLKLFVAAYQDGTGGVGRGNVRYFVGDDDPSTPQWTDTQTIQSGDIANNDFFGYSIACSADGSRLVVGARNEGGTGSAYIWDFGATYTETQKIVSSLISATDNFGHSTGISSDAEVIVIGARLEDIDAQTSSGATFVFTLDGTWTEDQVVVGSDTDSDDQIGHSVAISTTGVFIHAGAPSAESPTLPSGASYIFKFTTSYGQVKKLIPTQTPTGSDQFGFSNALSKDGTIAMTGAIGDNDPGSLAGSVYVNTAPPT